MCETLTVFEKRSHARVENCTRKIRPEFSQQKSLLLLDFFNPFDVAPRFQNFLRAVVFHAKRWALVNRLLLTTRSRANRRAVSLVSTANSSSSLLEICQLRRARLLRIVDNYFANRRLAPSTFRLVIFPSRFPRALIRTNRRFFHPFAASLVFRIFQHFAVISSHALTEHQIFFSFLSSDPSTLEQTGGQIFRLDELASRLHGVGLNNKSFYIFSQSKLYPKYYRILERERKNRKKLFILKIIEDFRFQNFFTEHLLRFLCPVFPPDRLVDHENFFAAWNDRKVELCLTKSIFEHCTLFSVSTVRCNRPKSTRNRRSPNLSYCCSSPTFFACNRTDCIFIGK